MNENTRSRLLLFFIGIPLFVAVLYFFPFGHFGVIAVVVLAIQYLSSRELRSILPNGGLRDPGAGMTIAGLVQSLAVYIACIFAENPFEPAVLLFFVSAVCLTIELAPLGLKKGLLSRNSSKKPPPSCFSISTLLFCRASSC